MSISDKQIVQDRTDGASEPGAAVALMPEARPVGYRKVAILGSADSSIHLAPIGDDSWELWGLPWSHDPKTFKGIQKWFDPHPLEWMKGRHEGYVDHLNSLAPAPIYMLQQYEEIKNSVRYPIEEIMAQFTGYRNRPTGTFASTIAYMCAFAILEKVSEIGLWGVDLLTEGEYSIQRPNVEYLLGVAEGRGVKLTIPPQSALLKGNHSYGYEISPDARNGINAQYLKERVQKYAGEKEGSLAKAQTFDGALQVCKELLQNQDFEAVWAILIEKAKKYEAQKTESLARAQTFDGAWQEADALWTQARHWERGGVVAANSEAG